MASVGLTSGRSAPVALGAVLTPATILVHAAAAAPPFVVAAAASACGSPLVWAGRSRVALTLLTAVLSRLATRPVMLATVVSAFSEAISPIAHVAAATFPSVSGRASVAAAAASAVAASLGAVDADVTLLVAGEAKAFFELAGATVVTGAGSGAGASAVARLLVSVVVVATVATAAVATSGWGSLQIFSRVWVLTWSGDIFSSLRSGGDLFRRISSCLAALNTKRHDYKGVLTRFLDDQLLSLEVSVVHLCDGLDCTFVLLESDEGVDTLHLNVTDGTELIKLAAEVVGGAGAGDLGDVDFLEGICVILDLIALTSAALRVRVLFVVSS